MMNANVLPPANARRLAIAWGLVCLLLLALLLALLPKANINSSVLAMLPQQTLGQMPTALNDGFTQRLDRQMVWLVSSGKTADAAVAHYWFEQLKQLPALGEIHGPLDEQRQQQWATFFWQHRNGLIDSETRARLANGGDAQAQWLLAQLYSTFSGVSGQELQKDPMMLMRGAQLALAQNSQRLTLMQQWLVTQDAQGNYWYFLHGELANNAFDMQQNRQLVQQLQAMEQQLRHNYPAAQLLSRGTLFYSDYASEQAKADISRLGIATLFGVLLLIVITFRSVRPLLLCLVSIAVGALTGTVVTLLIFGELHLMTLVMSMSIIGISADYTFYYLTERMVHGEQQTAWQSLLKVRSALLLALATTVAAYLLMLLAPFPAIRQMAIFAATGLSAACFTVLFWYPWLCRGLPVRPVPLMGIMLRWLAAWRRDRRVASGLVTLLTLFSLFGLLQLRVDDDISQLQALPSAIQTQEKTIAALTGQSNQQKWFVIYGDNAQQALQRMEAFEAKLQQAKQQQLITGYRLLPLNSLARQQQDLQLLQQAAPAVLQVLTAAGLSTITPDVAAMPVSAEAWLASPLSEGWRLMWLTLADGTTGLLIPVDGVTQSAALKALAQQQPGVAWVDRKQSFDALFALYRWVLTGLLLVALLVIATSALLRLGWRKGSLSLLPSLLSLSCGLAALSLSGQPVNLFSLLALVLVLGIGINYTLFFSNPNGTPLTSLLAISLAMISTLLTLGMLIFSSTQAISSFALVLVSGIFTAWLLSPLTMPEKKREHRK
ncbi:MMPL family transporter [Serratia microhaemolytica]|uniref:MMPL family transporter n=1 Tax=Serratia microhaemolytica TaxID=2675110 RepID=UPI000FDE9F7B|nr:MMPL family transporter [Serratia microhaemolytica]